VPKSGQAWNVEFLSRSPILLPFAPLLERWLGSSSWPTLDEYSEFAESHRRLRAPETHPVRFAPAEPKRTRSRRDAPLELDRLYDGRIALHAEVPCLNHSYHDLFNVLAWAAFPRAKRALHARQFRALERWIPQGASRLPNRRLREQDALTVFDEGGSVVVTRGSGLASVEAPRVLVADEGSVFVLFGHALMEHVAYGRNAVRSAAVVLPCDDPLPTGLELFACIDRALEARLLDPQMFAAPGADGVVEIDERSDLWFSR
jgi:Protein of unknown function (DUF3025)